jgi:hypothetical protein
LGQQPSADQKSWRARSFLSRQLRAHPLPAFLIIGAQKAGTTSLASYLAAHPNVVSPLWKEVHFFDLHYKEGAQWYRAHFPVGGRRWIRNRLLGRHLLAVDATPYYLMHPQVASRVSRLIPAAKIIILLRDPADRAYSHYHHEIRLGKENLSFDEAIAAEPSRIAGEVQRLQAEPFYEGFNYQHFTYLERGLYANQIGTWLRYFRPDQILVLSSEQFFQNPAIEYRKVLKFLGLPAWELPAYPPEHVGSYPPMPEAIRDRLLQYYVPHNRTLRRYLNSNWPGTGDEVVDRFSSSTSQTRISERHDGRAENCCVEAIARSKETA